MQPFFTETFGAPASLHRHGLRARDALNQARQAGRIPDPGWLSRKKSFLPPGAPKQPTWRLKVSA